MNEWIEDCVCRVVLNLPRNEFKHTLRFLDSSCQWENVNEAVSKAYRAWTPTRVMFLVVQAWLIFL